ncbi:AbrB/MazE/SpoVT family DNA-binding domain-containing protein [bacterium]|nr:AbrB/MazE/SpoVT family DNA-binding domain-containing protein [bacterium]MBU1753413.1 AbrB/MazE/SpoVT family DNA-binding domain-containing protein [bacterium]
MTEAVLTSKGQITIPKKIRDILGVKLKDKLLFIPTEDGVVMRSIKGNVLDLRGIVEHKGGEVDFKNLRKEFEKGIARKVGEKME